MVAVFLGTAAGTVMKGEGLFNWLQGLSGISVPTCQTNSLSVAVKSEWNGGNPKGE